MGSKGKERRSKGRLLVSPRAGGRAGGRAGAEAEVSTVGGGNVWAGGGRGASGGGARAGSGAAATGGGAGFDSSALWGGGVGRVVAGWALRGAVGCLRAAACWS